MKKLRIFAALAMALALSVSALTVSASAEGYSVEIAPENNLASSRWDFGTDNVGSGKATFDQNGIKLENFTQGSSLYAIYNAHKFTEFRMEMNALLHLTCPDGDENGDKVEYSNLYVSFMIADDTPIPAHTCPWNGHKAYFSVCFENLFGHPKVVIYQNEVWPGVSDGTQRNGVVDCEYPWNDGEYHWFEIELRKDTVTETYHGKDKEYDGVRINVAIDGNRLLTYFQRNDDVFSKSKNDYIDYVPFDTTKGYLGLWPSSSYLGGQNTDTTECYVQIKEMRVTSLDDGNTEPYGLSPEPDFDIDTTDFTPAASYEAGEPVELKLSDLFSYEGTDALQYTVTSSDAPLGKISNGFWVWTPEKAGTYYVKFVASNGKKEATTVVTIRVSERLAPPAPETPKKGCKGGMGAMGLGGIFLALAAVLKRGVRK